MSGDMEMLSCSVRTPEVTYTAAESLTPQHGECRVVPPVTPKSPPAEDKYCSPVLSGRFAVY